jgi:hypothetical protein
MSQLDLHREGRAGAQVCLPNRYPESGRGVTIPDTPAADPHGSAPKKKPRFDTMSWTTLGGRRQNATLNAHRRRMMRSSMALHQMSNDRRYKRPMRMLANCVALVACGHAITGCTTVGGAIGNVNDAVLRPENVRGSYDLIALQNSPLPFSAPAAVGSSCPLGGELTTTEVQKGSLVLGSREVEFIADAILHCRAADGTVRVDTVPQLLTGGYFVDGATIRVNTADGQFLRLAMDQASGEIRSADLGATWRRARDETHRDGQAASAAQATAASGAATGAPLHARVEQAQAAASPQQSRAYDCRRDPVLDEAPPVPPADTAGLGARIAAAFPEYHLTTEQEIACRFSEADWIKPHGFMPEMGSGRAWWVKRADFTQDGRLDVITVLTLTDDPEDDLIVALFADGRNIAIGRSGGGGFAVRDGDKEPVLYLVAWEKGADALRWNGSAFEEVQSDCCE